MGNIVLINEIGKIVSILLLLGFPCWALIYAIADALCKNADRAIWRMKVAAYQCERWNDAMINTLMQTTKGDEHTRISYINSIMEYMRENGCTWNDAVEHAIVSSIERTDYCIRMGWFSNRADWRTILTPLKFEM